MAHHSSLLACAHRSWDEVGVHLAHPVGGITCLSAAPLVSTCWSSGRSTQTHMCYACCATLGYTSSWPANGQEVQLLLSTTSPHTLTASVCAARGAPGQAGVGWSWGNRSQSLAISGANLQAGPGPIAGRIHPAGLEFDMSALCFPHFKCKFEVPLYILDNFSAVICQWYIIL